MGKFSHSQFRSPVRSDTDQRPVWEPCVHLARTQYALWRHPETLWRHPEAPIDTLHDVLREIFRSYVTPSRGDSWPRGHSIRSARGSTVLSEAAVAPRSPSLIENVVEKDTFYMRCHASLGRETGWGGAAALWVLYSFPNARHHHPAPPALTTPTRPSRPSWTHKAIHKLVTVKKSRKTRVSTRRTTAQA